MARPTRDSTFKSPATRQSIILSRCGQVGAAAGADWAGTTGGLTRVSSHITRDVSLPIWGQPAVHTCAASFNLQIPRQACRAVEPGTVRCPTARRSTLLFRAPDTQLSMKTPRTNYETIEFFYRARRCCPD